MTLKKWTGDTAGVSATAQGINIHAELYGKTTDGILLYDKKGSAPVRIDFTEEMRQGNIYRCVLSGISSEEYDYLFHEDGEPVMDPLAKRVTGHRLFGAEHEKAGDADTLRGCAFVREEFDWRGDKRPETAYEDSVYYGMHVRGFTKDASSRIREAGTFAGLQKKIPYLKKLGVTGIVLQPVYEFEECMKRKKRRSVCETAPSDSDAPGMRLNYWGYVPGYYMAPKNAYAFSEDAVTEFKTLVRQLHKNNLEIILQFYFEPCMAASRMRDILMYWAGNYHIDGFELIGTALPLKEIVLDPGLSDVKIWSEGFPYEEIEGIRKERTALRMRRDRKQDIGQAEGPSERLLADAGKGYQNTLRRFLKGDGGVLTEFLQCQRDNSTDHGRINFLATYNGFRLADVFSYERKHNEENGEDNRDGEEINYSWNCGIEGETRRKNVLALRSKLMKNAMTSLFTAQGTPFLFMGDEWGKSSGGNNNPYCQDNGTTWQKWNLKKSERQMLAFTAELIALRKAHGVLHQQKPLKLMDYLSCGCPDLSYHGEEAWRTRMDYQTRHIGVMFCGNYCEAEGEEGNCLYIAYNMHWEPHKLALPSPFKDGRWKLFLRTDEEDGELFKDNTGAEDPVQSVTVPGRSVRIYLFEKGTKGTGKRRQRKEAVK